MKEGDTYFPEFDERLFEVKIDDVVESEINYRLLTYARI